MVFDPSYRRILKKDGLVSLSFNSLNSELPVEVLTAIKDNALQCESWFNANSIYVCLYRLKGLHGAVLWNNLGYTYLNTPSEPWSLKKEAKLSESELIRSIEIDGCSPKRENCKINFQFSFTDEDFIWALIDGSPLAIADPEHNPNWSVGLLNPHLDVTCKNKKTRSLTLVSQIGLNHQHRPYLLAPYLSRFNNPCGKAKNIKNVQLIIEEGHQEDVTRNIKKPFDRFNKIIE